MDDLKLLRFSFSSTTPTGDIRNATLSFALIAERLSPYQVQGLLTLWLGPFPLTSPHSYDSRKSIHCPNCLPSVSPPVHLPDRSSSSTSAPLTRRRTITVHVRRAQCVTYRLLHTPDIHPSLLCHIASSPSVLHLHPPVSRFASRSLVAVVFRTVTPPSQNVK